VIDLTKDLIRVKTVDNRGGYRIPPRIQYYNLVLEDNTPSASSSITYLSGEYTLGFGRHC